MCLGTYTEKSVDFYDVPICFVHVTMKCPSIGIEYLGEIT